MFNKIIKKLTIISSTIVLTLAFSLSSYANDYDLSQKNYHNFANTLLLMESNTCLNNNNLQNPLIKFELKIETSNKFDLFSIYKKYTSTY